MAVCCDCCSQPEYALCFVDGDWACECNCRGCVERVMRGAYANGFTNGMVLTRDQLVQRLEAIPLWTTSDDVERELTWLKQIVLDIASGKKATV